MQLLNNNYFKAMIEWSQTQGSQNVLTKEHEQANHDTLYVV